MGTGQEGSGTCADLQREERLWAEEQCGHCVPRLRPVWPRPPSGKGWAPPQASEPLPAVSQWRRLCFLKWTECGHAFTSVTERHSHSKVAWDNVHISHSRSTNGGCDGWHYQSRQGPVHLVATATPTAGLVPVHLVPWSLLMFLWSSCSPAGPWPRLSSPPWRDALLGELVPPPRDGTPHRRAVLAGRGADGQSWPALLKKGEECCGVSLALCRMTIWCLHTGVQMQVRERSPACAEGGSVEGGPAAICPRPPAGTLLSSPSCWRSTAQARRARALQGQQQGQHQGTTARWRHSQEARARSRGQHTGWREREDSPTQGRVGEEGKSGPSLPDVQIDPAD